jgi:predicted neuraminidase
MKSVGPDSHASNVQYLPNGDIALAWFGGPGEGKSLCGIAISFLKPNATSWTNPVFVS